MNRFVWVALGFLAVLLFRTPLTDANAAGGAVEFRRGSGRAVVMTERAVVPTRTPSSEGTDAGEDSSGRDRTEHILFVCFLIQILAGVGLGCLVAVGLLSLGAHPLLLVGLGLATGVLWPVLVPYATALRILGGASLALLVIGLIMWAKRGYDARRAVVFVEADPYYAGEMPYFPAPSQQTVSFPVNPALPPSHSTSGTLMHVPPIVRSRPLTRSHQPAPAPSTGTLLRHSRPVAPARPKRPKPVRVSSGWPSVSLPTIAFKPRKPPKPPRPVPPPSRDAEGSLSFDD